MTDKTTIRALIEAVEAGDDGFAFSDDWINAWCEFYPEPDLPVSNGTAARLISLKAYHGSLDAALALHETLLPGWIWEKRGCEIVVQFWSEEYSHTDHDNPARAWLLAILKAHEAQQ